MSINYCAHKTQKPSIEWGLTKQEGLPAFTLRFIKMLSHLENRMVAYGHLVELDVDPIAPRAYTLGWDITVIAKMPQTQKGITMKINAGVNLGQQLAVQADRGSYRLLTSPGTL
jgi:hypothetical protein